MFGISKCAKQSLYIYNKRISFYFGKHLLHNRRFRLTESKSQHELLIIY